MENLENKYFIDNEKFNCPFCKNRGLKYIILGIVRFNESKSKELYAIFVECTNCHKISFHLSKFPYFDKKYKFFLLDTRSKEFMTYSSGFFYACEDKLSFSKILKESSTSPFYYSNIYDENSNVMDVNIDETLILNIPTSFFTIDDRVPKKFRDLVTEAEKCISMNCLTGASACIRKTIYEFINYEKLEGDDYTSKIKSLKGKYKILDDAYVDILSGIQGIMSDNVHEQSYENYDIQHAKGYIEVLKEAFNQIYVIPEELKSKQTKISSMCSAIKQDKLEKQKK